MDVKRLAASRLHPAIARIRPISHGKRVPSPRRLTALATRIAAWRGRKRSRSNPRASCQKTRSSVARLLFQERAAMVVCRSCSTLDARRLSQARELSGAPVAPDGMTDPHPRSMRRSARESRRRRGACRGDRTRHRPMRRTLHMELTRQSPPAAHARTCERSRPDRIRPRPCR